MAGVRGRDRLLLRQAAGRYGQSQFVHRHVADERRTATRRIRVLDVLLLFRIDIAMVEIVEVRDDDRHGQGNGKYTGNSTHRAHDFAEDAHWTHVAVADLNERTGQGIPSVCESERERVLPSSW